MRSRGYILLVTVSLMVWSPATVFASHESEGGLEYAEELAGDYGTIAGLINRLIEIINQLILLMVALAIVAFLWGIAQYMLNLDSEDIRQRMRKFMIWGIVAIFVMVSVYGILRVLQETFFPDLSAGSDAQTLTLIDSRLPAQQST